MCFWGCKMLNSGFFWSLNFGVLRGFLKIFVVWSSAPPCLSCELVLSSVSVFLDGFGHVQIFHTPGHCSRLSWTLTGDPATHNLFSCICGRINSLGSELVLISQGCLVRKSSDCWFILSAWTWKDTKLPVGDFCPLLLDFMTQWPKPTHLNLFLSLSKENKKKKPTKDPKPIMVFSSSEKWPNYISWMVFFSCLFLATWR